MRRVRRLYRVPLLLALASAATFAPARAQDDRELGWTDKAELTLVFTGGNASQSTFGLKNALDYVWPDAAFRFAAGGIRTEATTFARTATGTADDFTVTETSTSTVTAESYFARGRYERNVSAQMFLYGGSGWERNTFAGVQNRYSFVGGVGRTFAERERFKLRADVGLTYTMQDDVVPGPRDSFAGARLTYDLFRGLTASTDFGSTLILDENLETTEDLRADFTNWISVAIADGLALKTSLQVLFDNEPALTEIPLGTTGTTVLTPLDEVDTVFTLAVVLTF